MKWLYFDTESTGVDTIKDEPFSLAVILDIEDTTVLEEHYKMRPSLSAINAMSDSATKVHGYTKSNLIDLPENAKVYKRFIADMSKHVDKYDKSDKLVPVAFNGMFDIAMVSNWANRNDDKYIGSFINRKRLYDPLALIRILESHNVMPTLEHHTLSAVCEFLNISIDNAHDAMADTRALRSVHKFLKDHLRLSMDLSMFAVTDRYPFQVCRDCTMRESTLICNNCKDRSFDPDKPTHYIKRIP